MAYPVVGREMRNDGATRRWREAAGIELPSPEEGAIIAGMKADAVALLETLVLEESGIRAGDGRWDVDGENPVDAIIDSLSRASEELKRERRANTDPR